VKTYDSLSEELSDALSDWLLDWLDELDDELELELDVEAVWDEDCSKVVSSALDVEKPVTAAPAPVGTASTSRTPSAAGRNAAATGANLETRFEGLSVTI
jgi:hypothetical protein